jgi:hypothetical protein
MDKKKRLNRANDLYVKPLDEKEIPEMKQYILKMDKMQSEYKKKPSLDAFKLKNPSAKMQSEKELSLSKTPNKMQFIKELSLSKTPNKMQSVKSFLNLSNKIAKTQTGGILMSNDIATVNGVVSTSSQVLDELVRLKGLPGLQNTTMIILYKPILPGDTPSPQIRVTAQNGANTDFSIHVYVYLRNDDYRSTSTTPFSSHLNFGPERLNPIPGNLHSNIYNTFKYDNYTHIYAADFNNGNINIRNSNNVAPDINLSNFVFQNLRENEINVGAVLSPLTTFIMNTEHTREDIALLRSYTTDLYSVINAWLNIPGETNQPAFLANPHAVNKIAAGWNAGDLINEMRDKVARFDNFVYKIGRISSMEPDAAVSFYANHQPPQPPEPAQPGWQPPPGCNAVLHTSTVYRGMSRRYANQGFHGGVVFYTIPSYLHTSVDREQALGFAIDGLGVPNANPIIYRMRVGPNIPYWAYDERFLKSAIPDECEIIFARNCRLTRITPARILPIDEWDTQGIPVEDVRIDWLYPPYPPNWVLGDPHEPALDFIARIHSENQELYQYYPVNLTQYITANDIRANHINIFNVPGINVAYNGGGKTKRKKRKKTKKHLKLKKNKTI